MTNYSILKNIPLKLMSIFLLFFLISHTIFASSYICNSNKWCSCSNILNGDKWLNPIDPIVSSGICKSFGLKIIGENISLDCKNNQIKGTLNEFSGIIINGKNINVKNCNLTNFYNGILVENSSNITIENTSLSFNYGSGIELRNSFDVKIFNNTIFNNYWDGVFLFNSTNNKIYSNKINLNKVDGIQIFNFSINNDIWANNLTMNDGHSLAPVICKNNFSDLTNIGGSGKPIKIFSNKKQITFADISNISELILCNVSDSLITNLTFNNGFLKTDGILVVNSESITVSNSLLENTRAGVYLFNSKKLIIINNTFKDNDFGLRFMRNSSLNIITNNFLSTSNNFLIRVSKSNDKNFIKNYEEKSYLSFTNSGDFDILSFENDIIYLGDVQDNSSVLFNSKFSVYFLIALTSFILLFLLIKALISNRFNFNE